MSRWNVGRHETLRGRGINEPETEYTWCAFHDDHIAEEIHHHFPTHAEALAYADRMARTVEVTLPRPNSTWFERPVWELGDGVTVHQSIADQSQTITADYPRMSVPNSKRRELALALLALAEQEEHA